jgi:hypothetical protein
MTDSEKDDVETLERHANQLAESFDSVQIFVTRHEAGEKDGTVNIHLGAGNWFTRYGQVKEWVVKTEEDARVSRRPQD